MIVFYTIDKASSVDNFLRRYCYKISSRVWVLVNSSLYFNLVNNFKRLFSEKHNLVSLRSMKGEIKVNLIRGNDIVNVSFAQFLSIISKD